MWSYSVTFSKFSMMNYAYLGREVWENIKMETLIQNFFVKVSHTLNVFEISWNRLWSEMGKYCACKGPLHFAILSTNLKKLRHFKELKREKLKKRNVSYKKLFFRIETIGSPEKGRLILSSFFCAQSSPKIALYFADIGRDRRVISGTSPNNSWNSSSNFCFFVFIVFFGIFFYSPNKFFFAGLILWRYSSTQPFPGVGGKSMLKAGRRESWSWQYHFKNLQENVTILLGLPCPSL